MSLQAKDHSVDALDHTGPYDPTKEYYFGKRRYGNKWFSSKVGEGFFIFLKSNIFIVCFCITNTP